MAAQYGCQMAKSCHHRWFRHRCSSSPRSRRYGRRLHLLLLYLSRHGLLQSSRLRLLQHHRVRFLLKAIARFQNRCSEWCCMHSKNSKKSLIVNSVGENYYGCYYRSQHGHKPVNHRPRRTSPLLLMLSASIARTMSTHCYRACVCELSCHQALYIKIVRNRPFGVHAQVS